VIKSVTSRAIVVKSGNMSLGVNLLAALVKRVAQSLDQSFDIEILEMHHKAKIDAPSGTALMLGEAAAAGRGIDLYSRSARGRDGQTGARRPAISVLPRCAAAGVTGDHSVIFAGPMERIELTHRAEDRTMFAQGAGQGGAVGARQESRLLFDGRCAGALRLLDPTKSKRNFGNERTTSCAGAARPE